MSSAFNERELTAKANKSTLRIRDCCSNEGTISIGFECLKTTTKRIYEYWKHKNWLNTERENSINVDIE